MIKMNDRTSSYGKDSAISHIQKHISHQEERFDSDKDKKDDKNHLWWYTT